MAEASKNHVLQSVELVLDALIDVGVGVAEDVDPPGADRIHIAVAFEVVQPDAFAALYRYHRHVLMVFHLGAGVPEHRNITLHPIVVQAHVHLICQKPWSQDCT